MTPKSFEYKALKSKTTFDMFTLVRTKIWSGPFKAKTRHNSKTTNWISCSQFQIFSHLLEDGQDHNQNTSARGSAI